jgi:Na+/proline symporter
VQDVRTDLVLGFATTLGLTAVALTNNPAFPSYPNPMSTAQVSAGLSAAFAATTILGTGGAVALLIVLFMVCNTSDNLYLC